MTTIGIRRNPAVEAPGVDHIVGFESLDDVLQYADVIAMCVPSTSTTYHLLNAERIASLKPDAIIINAGRGNAIESQALADALAEGRIRGAALDVTEPEPLPANSPLWCEPKCLITPHVAGGNHLEITERSIISIALGNVRCYANGQSLDNRMPIKSCRSRVRGDPNEGSREERKGYDIEQMASCDGMVHDGIGVGVPVRVFVGSSGEDAYPVV